jgi:hypothetical protein
MAARPEVELCEKQGSTINPELVFTYEDTKAFIELYRPMYLKMRTAHRDWSEKRIRKYMYENDEDLYELYHIQTTLTKTVCSDTCTPEMLERLLLAKKKFEEGDLDHNGAMGILDYQDMKSLAVRQGMDDLMKKHGNDTQQFIDDTLGPKGLVHQLRTQPRGQQPARRAAGGRRVRTRGRGRGRGRGRAQRQK